ncbi:hypothetical protein [Couchioplanes azureus]|uniref:hypothetical protein n=1 Tax=Couchioplanes caeruleus TaxID=56438 RepID=UPI001670B74B|nr:hypothetical protein [Couchioplanes caeruleus]GGQ77847.1 hypothetical protein GCM10010166_54810 [Couchioplanes caeruleus subsp. azureus]
MRFFSNDARESADEQASDDRPERVQSEPVAVPGQRPPSPWSDTPSDVTRDAPAEVTRDVPAGAMRDAPAVDPRQDATGDRRLVPADEARHGSADDPRHATADDDEVPDRAADAGNDPDRTEIREPGPAPTAFGASTVGGAVAASASTGPLSDRPGATDRDADADDRDVANDGVDVALDDHGTFADPQVREEPTGTPAGGQHETVAVTPDQPDTFFAAGDAAAFQERWRDVQLRFVDSPKEATAEAAALVDEAVERLTASLRSRKENLGGDSDDTEALRVQLRGYRDILHRILGL